MPAATEARRLSMANVLPRHVWRKTCHDVEFRPDKRSSCCPGVEPGEPAGVAARCDRVAQERCPDTDSGWLWCPADGWAAAHYCSLFP
jgi:hypothetical protein